MATLQDVVSEIQTAVGAVSGIRAAPEYMPEQTVTFPFSQAYVVSGEYERRKTTMVGTHSIVVAIHVARKNMPSDIEAVMRFAKSVPNAIWGTVDMAGTSISYITNITYTFGELFFGDVQTIGFRFVVEGIRTEDTIS